MYAPALIWRLPRNFDELKLCNFIAPVIVAVSNYFASHCPLCKTSDRDIVRHAVVSCPNTRVSRELLFHNPEIGSYCYNQFVSDNNEETLFQYLLGSLCIYIPEEHLDSTERAFLLKSYTVELQWLEPLWDHENLFETGIVRASEGYY